MARITKMTEQLTWQSLRDNYFIGTRVSEELKRDKSGKIILQNGEPVPVKIGRMVNELQDAIDDGTLDKLITECAAKYHGGNVQAVLTALARNLDSQRYHLKNRDYQPNKAADETRLNTLVKFVADRRESKSRVSGDLPQWAFGPEQIDQIEDVAQLQKVINSIADVCSDKAGGTYVTHLGENYVEVAKANREYARKRKAALEAKENQVDEALLAKLAKGSKVVLTPEQAAQIVKILSK